MWKIFEKTENLFNQIFFKFPDAHRWVKSPLKRIVNDRIERRPIGFKTFLNPKTMFCYYKERFRYFIAAKLTLFLLTDSYILH
jgi:hypothetical protein